MRHTAGVRFGWPLTQMFQVYATMAIGRLYPRVVAGDSARKWLIGYLQLTSSAPFFGDRFQESEIESGDVPDTVFRFIPNPDIPEKYGIGKESVDIEVPSVHQHVRKQ